MRVVNRMAVSVVGVEPFVEWMRSRDTDFRTSTVTVVRARPFGTTYLLAEFDDESDAQEWVEDNHTWLFENQLSTWTEDESAWPEVRDLRAFRDWFRVDIHTTVVDVGDDDIEGEEL